nr:hypothetical protein [Thiohalobacter thiocyanaticus]
MVIHHHVHGAVGAEEGEHVDDVGVLQPGECPGFLKEQHAAAIETVGLGLAARGHLAVAGTTGEFRGDVFLDHHLLVGVGFPGQVHQAEAASAQGFENVIAVEASAGGQGLGAFFQHLSESVSVGIVGAGSVIWIHSAGPART